MRLRQTSYLNAQSDATTYEESQRIDCAIDCRAVILEFRNDFSKTVALIEKVFAWIEAQPASYLASQFSRQSWRGMSRFLTNIANEFNFHARKLEFAWSRTHGGFLDFLIPGYPPAALLIMAPLLYFLIFGPTIGDFGIGPSVLFLASCCAFVFFVHRFRAKSRLLAVEVACVIITAGCAWLLAGSKAREATSGLYRHVLMLLIPGLAIFVASAAPFFARFTVRGYFKDYRRVRRNVLPSLIRRVELFVIPRPPRIHVGRFLRSLFTTPIHNLLLLLLPSSVALVLLPRDLFWIVLITLAATCVILGCAGIDDRLDSTLSLLRRVFLRGGPLLLSLAVIALAAARLLDFSYVTTLLDATAAWTVVEPFLALYVICWFYEVWIGYILCVHLLALLSSSPVVRATRVPYRIRRDAIASDTPGKRRFVQVHGARFVVVGRTNEPGPEQDSWETYDRDGLFRAIVTNAFPSTSPPILEERFGILDLRQRLRFYFVMLDALLTVVLACAGAYLYGVQRAPEVTLPTLSRSVAEPNRAPPLQALLFDDQQQQLSMVPARRSAILVAASGGGTRAALYTASVLRGLADHGVLKNVVLVSGVSGGSAALTYFVTHHDHLVHSQPSDPIWDAFAQAMAFDYIDDVIRGYAEWRAWHSLRPATLLAESFDRSISAPVGPLALKDAPIPLIYNATLTGVSLWDTTRKRWLPPHAEDSGSRLVITNIEASSAFPRVEDGDWESHGLTNVVLRDGHLTLAMAAALSANFPPVFADALIEETERARYWATDGGASENLGEVSLLYALKGALAAQCTARSTARSRPLPIDILLVDASATPSDYIPDGGVAALLGASQKYAEELSQKLLLEIRRLYARLGGVDADLRVHYLPMPLVFRTRGGVKTHWLLASNISLCDPSEPEPAQAQYVRLTSGEIQQLIMDLHTEPLQKNKAVILNNRSSIDVVDGWIAKDRHRRLWRDALISVTGAATPN